MLFLILLLQLLLLYRSQLVYQGTRKLNLASNNIVWSDQRYIEFYGDRYSFVVDLQANFDRFRNIANLTESNVTLKDAFRARGRTYEKSLQQICSFENLQSLPIHPTFITDLNTTYFVIQGDNLILGLINNKCQYSTIDLSKSQPSPLKQVIRVDDFYLGIRTQQILYVINKQNAQITQQLNLKVCSIIDNNSQYKFTTNYFVAQQSLRFVITSKDGICIFQRLSQNADFNFIKQHKSYLDQYPSFAQINDSVSFVTTRNCTQIKLNLDNAKTTLESITQPPFPLRDKLVDSSDYSYYWSRITYYRAHMYLQSGQDVYLQQNMISDRFLANATVPIKSACGGNYATDIYITFFLDADGIKIDYPATTLQSVKDYNFDKLGCYSSKLQPDTSNYPVFAAGITDNELTVAYIQGKYDRLFDTYKTTLSANYEVNRVLVGVDYNQYTAKYNYFFIILTNTDTKKLTCFSFLANNSKIALVGKRDINATQFITSNGRSVLWHEAQGTKHVIKELTSTLQIIKYDIGEDFKSIQPIHFCQKCFRIVRPSGRVDIYSSSPYQINRISSYFLQETEEQLFSVYNYQTKKIYIQYNDKRSITTLDPGAMFYSRTISDRDIDICQKSILQPIFASPQRAYTIFISVSEIQNKQQIRIIRTYYEPYYGYYYDNSSYISLTYNASISFKIASYRYFQKLNTLVAQLIPSYDTSRTVLSGIKLDFLQLANDYMLWDWIIEMQPQTKIISYQLDQYSLVIMHSGGKMSRYQPNGIAIKKIPNGIRDNTLPYLVSKDRNVVGYYGYYSGFNTKTVFADSLTGEILYLMDSLNFMAISPNGLLLAQKNQDNAKELKIYKQVNILGRIKLSKAINKNSKIWFMNDHIVLQIQIVGSRVEVYLFDFKEDPFIYSSYAFASGQGSSKNLISFNEVNIAVGIASKIIVLDQRLNIVQTLSTSFIENGAPQSISMAEGGNIYAKMNNLLFIWRDGPCPDGLSNNEGVCGNGEGVSTQQLAVIIGGSAGGAALLAGSVLFIRKWRKRKGKSLLQSEGVNAIEQ